MTKQEWLGNAALVERGATHPRSLTFNLIVQSANMIVDTAAIHTPRHARARRGHPRLAIAQRIEIIMAGTTPGHDDEGQPRLCLAL